MSGGDALQLLLQLARGDFALEVDLTLPASGISVLFGPSGSGKTSVLRCVAGLERAASGRVQVGQAVWQDARKGIFLPPWQRDVGYVFQEASLFAHLNVEQNLAFGLKRSDKPGGAQALEHAIELLGIGHLLRRETGQLSGGERQRVAIARALATQPALLLLDEPLAALDLVRRQEILPWLEKTRDELRMPMLYVTHSADELVRLADHVVVLEQGRVKAAGSTHDVLSEIENPAIVGDEAGVVLRGTIAQRDMPWQLAQVVFDGGAVWVRDTGLAQGREVRLRVLARDVSLASQEPRHSSIQNQIQGQIEAIVDDVHPSQALVRVRCGSAALVARVTRRALDSLGLTHGSAVWAQVKSVAVME
jgi:molybdate transport system ATP-binding protein